MHFWFRLILTVGLALGLSPVHAKSRTWVGTAIQTQDDAPPIHWRVSLVFTGEKSARIDYPTLKCGGVLRFVRRAGSIHVFRERIRYGREICIDNGTITVRRQGARLIWRWTGANTPYPTMKGYATLSRAR